MAHFGTFQAAVAALWASSDFAALPNQRIAASAKLAEEAGEVVQEILRFEGWSSVIPEPPTDEALDHLQTEIGDVLFVLARICNLYEIDLAAAGGDALERFSARYSEQRRG